MTPRWAGPIRFLDADRNHLGFLLMAGHGWRLDLESSDGDCVFMPLPRASALFEQEPYLILADHRDVGEHHYRVTQQNGSYCLVVSGSPGRDIHIRIGDDGAGEWAIRTGDGERPIGIVELVNAMSE